MLEANKKALASFLATETCCVLIPIETPVMDPQNEFIQSRAPTIPYYSEVLVPENHEFGDKFERERLYGKTIGKCELNDFVTRL